MYDHLKFNNCVRDDDDHQKKVQDFLTSRRFYQSVNTNPDEGGFPSKESKLKIKTTNYPANHYIFREREAIREINSWNC